MEDIFWATLELSTSDVWSMPKDTCSSTDLTIHNGVDFVGIGFSPKMGAWGT